MSHSGVVHGCSGVFSPHGVPGFPGVSGVVVHGIVVVSSDRFMFHIKFGFL